MHGYLHHGEGSSSALVLTHGAGGNCSAPLLVSLAEEFSQAGVNVLRCDLPFRQRRAHGPPSPGSAKDDQQGLRRAVALLRSRFAGPLFLGGQSYGGRQASMLVASEPELVQALLLLSYPLHPPARPEQKRTAHFPNLQTPTLFVHGTSDTFGSIQEMEAARALIPGVTKLLPVPGAGHSLLGKGRKEGLTRAVVDAFQALALATNVRPARPSKL